MCCMLHLKSKYFFIQTGKTLQWQLNVVHFSDTVVSEDIQTSFYKDEKVTETVLATI